MPDTAFSPGEVVAGKYRIEQVIGRGGMGSVLGARHMQLGERVALKVLHPDAARDAESVARFFREARAASRIKGDHVVRVLDVGSLEDGTPYLVMEYLEGHDLGAVVERRGTLPLGVAVDYVLQACEALAEAHAVGIVHRDVKPSNLFLTTRIDGSECVKVLDFGISKAMSAVDATQPDFGLTRTQSVLGSPQYMAPEQMRSSKRVDGRTDIWAIGTILHELLTGSAPYVAQTMPELFAMILTDPTPPLRAKRPDVPEALDRVVMRCLEKDPERRYPTVLEVARALAPFGTAPHAELIDRIARVSQNASAAQSSGSQPSIPEILVAPPLTPSAPLDDAKTTVDPVVPSPSRSRLPLVAAGIGVLVVVGIGLLVLALDHRSSAAPSASATTAEPSAATSVAAAESAGAVATAPPTAASSVAPSAIASVHATTTARPRPTGAPHPRATAATASATLAPPAATATTTKPMATATSRYD